MIKLQQRPTWNHPKHNATKGFSTKRLQSKFCTVSLIILPTVFRLVPPNLLEAFFFICFFLSGLQNRRRLLSTYNWVSVCIYRHIPPFQICETQRRASWTKLMRVNSHTNHFCPARSSCWCGSLAEDISVCPHTRFHPPPPLCPQEQSAQQPPVSGSGRTYCSTISLRVTVCRAIDTVMKSQCAAAADGTTGAAGEKGPADPFSEGTGPPAGALKDHPRRFIVADDTNISHSLGCSEGNRANLKCVFFPGII